MILSKQDLEALCETAKVAAVAAGKHIQSQFDKHYNKGIKDGVVSLAAQVVTEVDIKAQEIILNHLQSSIDKYDLGLLTEESIDNQSRLEKDYFWCIDPMDGTLPFTEGRTGYAVSIALVTLAGDPVIGVVNVPDLAMSYTSIKGTGVWLNDQPFAREVSADATFHFYMDSSLKTESYFEEVNERLNDWAEKQEIKIQYHDGYGAVCNALEVMDAGLGCYFKFPKKQNGGGSIWDFAATRLFFEELDLYASNFSGNRLHLNNEKSTFMNEEGVIYATDQVLARFILELSRHCNN